MVFNIDFEIAAVIVLAFFYVYFRIQYDSNSFRATNIYFRYMIVSTIFAAVMDCVTAVMISYANSIPLWLNYAANSLYFMLAATSVFTMTEYFRVMVNGDKERSAIEKFNRIVYYCHMLLVATSGFTHLTFYFDDARTYTHGPLYAEVFAIPVYFVIVSVFKLIFSRTALTKKQFFSIIAFLVITELGTILQVVLFKDMLMVYFSSAIGAIVLLFAFETPDDPLLMKTQADLKASRDELEKAMLAAQEASRAKTVFLSNMSHDIRTPMNAIVGFTKVATEHADDPDEVRECLDIIQTSGDHLLSLINDVLDMSRIESGKTKLEPIPINLHELMNGLKEIILGNVTERRQEYIEDYSEIRDANVLCDRLRLNQILLNCMGNSVKFTDVGGKISVKVAQLADDADVVGRYEFRIKDTGKGMSKEFLARIFEPFEREKSETANTTQGTGLGMAITKNLVEMMNGSIVIESELGVGTEYIITIPLKILSASEVSEYNKKENTSETGVPLDKMLSALEGKKFVVVDDNLVNRRIVKRILEERSMLVEECSSGAEAIDKLKNIKSGDVDLVFMDVQMPMMDGYETTEKIRALNNPIAAALPIIAMTANAFEEDRKNALLHGMNSHVAKPFKLEELIGVLYKLLVSE